jgi:hypothetical protein
MAEREARPGAAPWDRHIPSSTVLRGPRRQRLVSPVRDYTGIDRESPLGIARGHGAAQGEGSVPMPLSAIGQGQASSRRATSTRHPGRHGCSGHRSAQPCPRLGSWGGARASARSCTVLGTAPAREAHSCTVLRTAPVREAHSCTVLGTAPAREAHSCTVLGTAPAHHTAAPRRGARFMQRLRRLPVRQRNPRSACRGRLPGRAASLGVDLARR